VGLRLYYDAASRASNLRVDLPPAGSRSLFLRASASGLLLDAVAPTGSTAKFQDSTAIKFSAGNLWKEVGTWTMMQP
jgi:hypothetical protein